MPPATPFARLGHLPLRFGRRSRRLLASLAGLVVVFAALGFWVLPPVVRGEAETRLGALLQRPTHIGALRFNPFLLVLELDDVRVGSPEDALFTLGNARFDLEWRSLFAGAPVVRELRLDAPVLRLVRQPDGGYNVSDLIARFLAQPPSPEPTRYALYNLSVRGGSVSLDDRQQGVRHCVEALELGLPFLSNLPDQLEVFVEPLLQARIDGTLVKLSGRARPFASRREAELDLHFDAFDLGRVRPYLPAQLPIQLTSGQLSSHARLRWQQTAQASPSLELQGTLGLSRLALAAEGAPLLSAEQIELDIASLQPLTRAAALRRLRVSGARLALAREGDGRFNLQRLAVASVAALSVPAAPESAAAPAARPWQWRLDSLELAQAALDWRDQRVPGGAQARIAALDFKLAGLSNASDAPPARSELALTLDGATRLSGQGELQLTPLLGRGRLKLENLPLGRYRPYYAAQLPNAVLEGRGDLDFAYHVEPGSQTVRVDDGRLLLSDLSLSDLASSARPKTGSAATGGRPSRESGRATQPSAPTPKSALLRLARLELGDFDMDLGERRASAAQLHLQGLQLQLLREHDGEFELAKLLQPPQSAAPVQPAAVPPPAGAPAWRLALTRLALQDSALRYEDRRGASPIRLDFAGLTLEAGGLSNSGRQAARLRLAAKVNRRGTLAAEGELDPATRSGRIRLDLRAIDILAAQPYLDQHFQVLLTRGALSAKGELMLDASAAGAPPGVRYRGSLGLSDFASIDRLNDADLLRWKSLQLDGVEFASAPLKLHVRQIALASFYSRLILNAQGRFNLREIGAQRDEAQARAEAAGAAPESAPLQTGGAASADVAPDVRIEQFTLQDGNIAYEDRFVRPNYSANLTEIGGRLAGLATDPASTAELELRGAVDHSAPVEISGRLNPLRRDRFLDLRAAVTGVDLTGVSSYAGKYVGYGIDKGKLSMKLHYQVQDRKLQAENQVFLDQLTFGERVDSPDATQLPVLLAVALLKNSRGEIDINLPISGSLDDPQFSIGGVVLQVIGNLLRRAVTAPFSLLASLFDSGEDISRLAFAPGSDALGTAAGKSLENLAKALKDRPGLRLEISGRADPEIDREGLKRENLLAKLRIEKARRRSARGEESGPVAQIEIDPAEYPELLRQVYDAERFPKPRNLLGLSKSLPVEEMEKLILSYAEADDEALRALAARRAQAARAWLVQTGGIDASRLFLRGSELAPGSKDGSPGETLGVEFALQ